MDEKEILAWCIRNRATVWFGSKGWLGDTKGVEGVKVKVPDKWCVGAIWGRTLQDVISSIEKRRKDNADVKAALASLPPVDVKAIAAAYPSPHNPDDENITYT